MHRISKAQATAMGQQKAFILWRMAARCVELDDVLCSTAASSCEAMPVSDLDIRRAAHLWIDQHGDAATAKAREMVAQMRAKGDADGADTWLRIIAAIGTLGAPPTGARR
jgi:hypothetical protein